MSEIIRSGTTPFTPRARILRLLGGELIRDEVMAITELVKNAHDADASHVLVDFSGASNGCGEIRIEDDGEGMDVETLLSSWMQPAGSTKSNKDLHYTPSGRRVLGEKGVGRFAVDRLGQSVELVSRRAGSRSEIVAQFDWDQFDDETKLLSEVHSSWKERRAIHFPRSGTLLRVTELRAPWTERTFRRLSTRLQRLLSPFHDDQNFKIEVRSDEFPDYSGILEAGFLHRSPYRLVGSFDGDSTISVAINGGNPVAYQWNGAGHLSCGPVKITIHSFDLESEAISRVGPRMEVRAWLREWSGISVYRDGFRVLPYGEPDDDWLRLDQRRVNNPVVRFSNNQICGFVEISRDASPELRDQTNRGGLIQNKAFEDLRRLVLFIIQILEAERQCVRHPKKNGHDQGPFLGRVDGDELALVGKLRQAADKAGRSARDPIRKVVSQLETSLISNKRRRDAELASYLDLAAAGQSVAFLHHSLRPRVDALHGLMKDLRSDSNGQMTSSQDSVIWNLMEDCLEEISETVDVVARAAPAGRRIRRGVDVGSELEAFKNATNLLLSKLGIELTINVADGNLLRVEVPPETLQQVLHILLWNSLEWFGEDQRGKIRIYATRKDGNCQIVFSDNGPGVADINAERVFEPHFSLKENGRGMGLAIARHLLSEHGGSIRLIRDRRRKGTSFEICLRSKRSRATKG